MKGALTMRISISGKNMEVSDYLYDLINKKVMKLERYFPENTVASVTMAVEKNRHIVEVTIPFDGGIIRSEEVTGDMYASIDKVVAKLEKQIIKHRTKLEKSLREEAFSMDAVDYSEYDSEPDARLVKVKSFEMKPMTVDEAMLQLDLLGHSFFMFRNAQTDEINVLYKRKDGNFGLIEGRNDG